MPISEPSLQESFPADSSYLHVVFLRSSCVLIYKMAEQSFLDDAVHNLIYLSFFLNDLSLLDFVVAYVDMASIIVHRDVVYGLRVNLRASLPQ
jgi:hypothetical protein